MNAQLPANTFKRAIREGRPQIGLWSSLCSNVAAEVIAGAGFDWILIDTEHAPNELPMVFSQLQALVGGTAAPVVRPAWNDMVLMKRLLDIGGQNFLIPYVQTPEEARAAVAATRYPPKGVRGVAVTHRANRYGRVKDYYKRCEEEICVIVQIETRQGLQNIDAIAAVDGVDGLFVGPSDLAAALGHLGDPAHAEVRTAIGDAFKSIRAAGKAPGILAPIEADARHWLSLGCVVLAVGSDAGLLARHSEELAARFKSS
ncbi:MAG: HpcH/HpaI aldolase/citrate lyase family protein [Verrucomicrobia subdivision 3 bacterium]|nr:HpcH/HpaI aldolase/citrate lyase family protein [Limisphaerales bacterium]